MKIQEEISWESCLQKIDITKYIQKNHWTRTENLKAVSGIQKIRGISEMALQIGERIDYSIMVLGKISYQHRENRLFPDALKT